MDAARRVREARRSGNLESARQLALVLVVEHPLDAELQYQAACVHDQLGREAEGLDRPTYPGPLGQRIFNEVSKAAWAEWLKQQTMLVNENRLNLADARARQYLARQMEKHFFGEGADAVTGYVPPAQS